MHCRRCAQVRSCIVAPLWLCDGARNLWSDCLRRGQPMDVEGKDHTVNWKRKS